MTRRALLIGSETYGLQGCNADVDLMQEVLTAHGFESVDVRRDQAATRAGIFSGLDALVASITDPGDAVLVYYSGHGARLARPDAEARKATRESVSYQFIVPFDMDESEPGDFRGVLSEELTWYQRRLTDAFETLGAVPNVTTILDCCHSGYMARAIDTLPKSVDLEAKMFRMRGIREHLAQLAGDKALHGLVTNPHAVRLVACQPEQSAFEFPSPRGGRHGALTDAFATVLEEVGATAVPWGTVAELVRRRVRSLVAEQRPDIEGPSDRLLFSSDSFPTSSALALTTIDDETRIEAAPILGIAVGDEFRLVAPTSDTEIATGVVTKIDASGAVLDISPATARDAVRQGALAVPTSQTQPRTPVFLDVADDEATGLRTRLVESTRLVQSSTATGAFVHVTRGPDGLVLCDDTAEPWRIAPYPDDDAGGERLFDDIEAIAVGHRLLDLPQSEGSNALGDVVTIEFGTVATASDDHARTPLPARGRRLQVGTRMFLTLTNTSTDPLFVWVFDVGVSGRSTLLTNAAPSGTRLGACGAEDDTTDLWGPDGESLTWPADVPKSAGMAAQPGRWERFVILVADQRADLSSLSSRVTGSRGAPSSALQALVDEARTGRREVAPSQPDAPALRYRIDTIEFMLDPV